MISLTKQVASLELSEKLKELGYPQEGLFWWDLSSETITHSQDFDEMPYETGIDEEDRRRRVFVKNSNRFISAPTVAELGMMVPKEFWYKTRRYSLGFNVSFDEHGKVEWGCGQLFDVSWTYILSCNP